jgi:hypothetical protein
MISLPRAITTSRTSGFRKICCIAPCSMRTSLAGVPAGAKSPCQLPNSYPSTPDSAMVGTSGSMGERFAVVTP